MKYNSIIPGSALLFYAVVFLLMKMGILPAPSSLLEPLQALFEKYSFILIFFIIMLESIVYVGMYFPGQLLAVLIVVFSDGSFMSLALLTVISVISVTISAGINYYLGYNSLGKLKMSENHTPFRYRSLLLSMIHINLLALYIYKRGAEKADKKIIWVTGLLNLPYYSVLIFGTFYFKNEIMAVAQHSIGLVSLLFVWLGISLFFDIKRKKKK